MSCGFSAQDILSASNSARRLYESCKDSSDVPESLAVDLSTLDVTLKETLDIAACNNKSLTLDQQQELAAAGRLCSSVLDTIHERFEEYKSLQTHSQRARDCGQWSMEDAAAALQGELVSSTRVLTDLNTTISNASQARIEQKLIPLLAEIRDGKREKLATSASRIRSLPADNEEAWSEMRRELEDIGFDMNLCLQDEKFIVQYFKQTVETGEKQPRLGTEEKPGTQLLPTLVESSRESGPVFIKSHSIAPEDSPFEASAVRQLDIKRLSDSIVQEGATSRSQDAKDPEESDFPRLLPQERPREMAKKRTVFRRALKGISTRISLVRDSLDSPLRSPLSPKTLPRLAKQSSVDAQPLSIPQLPPMPPMELSSPQWMQARTRSNTSKTMVTRLSEGGGEIDVATGYSTKINVSQGKRRSKSSVTPRPQSESITDQKPAISDLRASSSKGRSELPFKRTSKDIFDVPGSKYRRESDLSTTRRPSDTCSEQSTKRSSRTSGALSPYEKETFERHNATMKAYFERRPEQEAKMDAARRSLQVGNRLSGRAPPSFNRLVASGMEVRLPTPPPKDDKKARRHTQPVSPTTIKHLGTVPSASSLGSDSARSNGESGMLTFMIPPELLEVQGRPEEAKERSEQECMMDELTSSPRQFSINQVQENGETYLLSAAAKGFSEAAVFLLQSGANVLMKNRKGENVLHVAVAANHPDTVEAILDNVPAKSISELWACPVLHTAIEMNSARMAEALLENGADVGVRDTEGRTVYEVASQHKLLDMTRLLLDYGARISSLEPVEDIEEENFEPADAAEAVAPITTQPT